MPIDREIASGEVGTWGIDQSSEERLYIVSCPIGADPRNEVSMSVGRPSDTDPALICTGISKRQFITRSAVEGVDRWIVGVEYGTGNVAIFPQLFDDWRITYGTDAIDVPAFKSTIRYTARANTNPTVMDKTKEWEPEPMSIPLQYMFLEKKVYVQTISLNEILYIRSQCGMYHRFPNLYSAPPPAPQFPPTALVTWQFQGPNIRPISTSRIEIIYAWMSDPGNPAFVPPVPDEIEDPGAGSDATEFIVPTSPRPPFWKYYVIPSRMTNPAGPAPFVYTKPKIIVRDPAPQSSYDGHLSLPGDPIP